MRDPARIDRIIGLLRAYWHANPDLRLGQIVGNFMPRAGAEPGDSYYVEDIVIERALKQAGKQVEG